MNLAESYYCLVDGLFYAFSFIETYFLSLVAASVIDRCFDAQDEKHCRFILRKAIGNLNQETSAKQPRPGNFELTASDRKC